MYFAEFDKITDLLEMKLNENNLFKTVKTDIICDKIAKSIK